MRSLIFAALALAAVSARAETLVHPGTELTYGPAQVSRALSVQQHFLPPGFAGEVEPTYSWARVPYPYALSAVVPLGEGQTYLTTDDDLPAFVVCKVVFRMADGTETGQLYSESWRVVPLDQEIPATDVAARNQEMLAALNDAQGTFQQAHLDVLELFRAVGRLADAIDADGN